MTIERLSIDVRCRGTQPHRDYSWIGMGPRVYGVPGDLGDDVEGWKGDGLTAVMWAFRPGHVRAYLAGLRSPEWPDDHQGRNITAQLVLSGPVAAEREIRVACAAVLTRDPPGNMLQFDSEPSRGWTVREDALLAYLADEPFPSNAPAVPHGYFRSCASPADVGSELLGAVGDQVASVLAGPSFGADAPVVVVSALLNRATLEKIGDRALLVAGTGLRVGDRKKDLTPSPQARRPWTVAALVMVIILLVILLAILR